MNSRNLQIELSGEGYEQIIKLIISEKNIIYNGLCDDLVTSVNGSLELKLNWNQENYISNYELKKANDYIVLIPTIVIPEDFSNFIPKSITVMSFEDVLDLWDKLGYDSSELNKINTMNNEDWSLLWLLNMNSSLKTLQIEQLANWAISNILAEEPDEYPKVIDIIKLISSKKINFLSESFSVSSTEEAVVVYMENSEKEIGEWNALSCSNRHQLLLGNGCSIEYRVV